MISEIVLEIKVLVWVGVRGYCLGVEVAVLFEVLEVVEIESLEEEEVEVEVLVFAEVPVEVKLKYLK